jgi:hypothetical protein
MLHRTGTVKKRHVPTTPGRDFLVVLVRHAENRVRFHLDEATLAEIDPELGDRLHCSQIWDDGSIETAVDVYAVHDGGFVDASGWLAQDQEPDRVRLRRYV